MKKLFFLSMLTVFVANSEIQPLKSFDDVKSINYTGKLFSNEPLLEVAFNNNEVAFYDTDLNLVNSFKRVKSISGLGDAILIIDENGTYRFFDKSLKKEIKVLQNVERVQHLGGAVLIKYKNLYADLYKSQPLDFNNKLFNAKNVKDARIERVQNKSLLKLRYNDDSVEFYNFANMLTNPEEKPLIKLQNVKNVVFNSPIEGLFRVDSTKDGKIDLYNLKDFLK